jgi:hypothetical protein
MYINSYRNFYIAQLVKNFPAFMNLKVHYRDYKSPPLSFPTFTYYFSKISWIIFFIYA